MPESRSLTYLCYLQVALVHVRLANHSSSVDFCYWPETRVWQRKLMFGSGITLVIVSIINTIDLGAPFKKSIDTLHSIIS
jgi:hypothetical protein